MHESTSSRRTGLTVKDPPAQYGTLRRRFTNIALDLHCSHTHIHQKLPFRHLSLLYSSGALHRLPLPLALPATGMSSYNIMPVELMQWLAAQLEKAAVAHRQEHRCLREQEAEHGIADAGAQNLPW